MSNMVIQTNVLALNSHRNLRVIGTKQFNASAKLSSGYKINSAADDASGLAISEKMRAQIRGLDMASKNAQDGISLIQTAEGGLQEVDNMVQRIRELVVQAANDTNDYSTNDRKKLQDEINQLTQGIDQMAKQVEFNAKKVLDGSLMDTQTREELMGEVDVRLKRLTGSTAGTITMNKTSVYGKIMSAANKKLSDATKLSGKVSAIGVSNFADVSSVESFLEKVGKAISSCITARANLSGSDVIPYDQAINAGYALQDAIRQLFSGQKVVNAAISSKAALSGFSGTGLWFQTGSNSAQGMVAGIGSVRSDVLGIGYGDGRTSINVDSEKGWEISAFIDVVDAGLQYVTSQRAKLGAIQNRLEFTKNSLEVTSENLSASESRIRDADMGKEMMRLTAANILQQAGISMLAQANQAPQNVLQLLR